MRNRFNKRAVCSSGDYKRSRKAHLSMLEENHRSFCLMVVSGEISIDVPVEGSKKLKTIRVFGKDMQVSVEEYNIHCKSIKL